MTLEQKLAARLLLSRRVEGDRLVLDDAVLLAAVAGTRKLSAAERAALEQSPLTVRRLRQLLLEQGRRRAANDDSWSGSHGMLRAAASAAPLSGLVTDDGWWSLHFLPQGASWQVVLKLSAAAPFASRLVREQPVLRVTDGGGAIIVQGRLDADGECEAAWPFESPPAPHFHQFGAAFAVSPAHAT